MDRRGGHPEVRRALTERKERALDARVGGGKPRWGERGGEVSERTGRLVRDLDHRRSSRTSHSSTPARRSSESLPLHDYLAAFGRLVTLRTELDLKLLLPPAAVV